MPEVFKAKLRKVGSSVGVLIPKERLEEMHVNVGDEVEICLLKHLNIIEFEKGFGIGKHMPPFERDKKTRSFDDLKQSQPFQAPFP